MFTTVFCLFAAIFGARAVETGQYGAQYMFSLFNMLQVGTSRMLSLRHRCVQFLMGGGGGGEGAKFYKYTGDCYQIKLLFGEIGMQISNVAKTLDNFPGFELDWIELGNFIQ